VKRKAYGFVTILLFGIFTPLAASATEEGNVVPDKVKEYVRQEVVAQVQALDFRGDEGKPSNGAPG